MHLIDTDVFIWIIRGNKKYTQWLQERDEKVSLGISTITIAEIFMNIFPSELQNVERIIDHVIVEDVTSSIAKRAGWYWQEHHKRLKKLSITDCLIASTAYAHKATLVTLNTRHFPMRDITILNPSKP